MMNLLTRAWNRALSPFTCTIEQATLLAAGIALPLVFVAAIYATPYAQHVFNTYILDVTQSQVDRGMKAELDMLDRTAVSVARLDSLHKRIDARDTAGIAGIISAEKQKNRLDTLFVSDVSGVVLARAEHVSERGDNVLLRYPELLRAADGALVHAYIATPELSLVVAAPVRDQRGDVVAIIYAGKELGADFSLELKQKYFLEQGHIAFYSTTQGVSGSSLEDSSAIGLLNQYFDIGSPIIAPHEDVLDNEVWVDGHYYPVRKEVLSASNGIGILIFAEANHTAVATMLAAAFALLFFTILVLWVWLRHHERIEAPCVRLAASVTLAVFVCANILLFGLFDMHTVKLRPLPFPIYNSTMHIDPESDVVEKGTEKQVAIVVRTGGEAINAISANLKFDPARMRVEEVVTDHSICTDGFFIEKNFDNAAGTVDVVCGIPTPGYSGTKGIVAEILFTPLTTGPVALTFASTTQVLANDGLGTNVLRETSAASYQVADPNGAGSIFSSTHPNSARWYSERLINFGWALTGSSNYLYYFGTDTAGVPHTDTPAGSSSLRLSAPADGTYFFTLSQLAADGRNVLSTFTVHIDSTPPAQPDVRFDKDTVAPGELLRIAFSGSDSGSGLQKNFYVKLDNGVLFPVKSPMQFAFASRGMHDITVRAFDKAGNWSETTRTVTVE